MHDGADTAPDVTVPATIFSGPWRGLAALLQAIAVAGVWFVLVFGVVLYDGPPVPPLAFARAVLTVAGIPWLAALLVIRAHRGAVRVGADRLVLERSGLTVEVPRAAVASIRPWRMPLPQPGAQLVGSDGRALAHAVAGIDGVGLAAALSVPVDRAASAEWGRARVGWRRRWWDRPLWKLGVVGLVPTLIFFRAHQWIAYGGTWGQYHLEGPAAYLRTLADYWILMTGYLLLGTAAGRSVAEVLGVFATAAVPARAGQIRRLVEVGCRLLFYVGVPAVLLLRFAPW